MFGENIRRLRIASNYSQVDMAKMLSVSKQTVSNWENNNIMPSVDMLVKIAGLFGVTTDSLLGRESVNSLDVSGLPDECIRHLNMLIDDLRK